MIEAFQDLETWQQVVAVLAIFTGVMQLALLLSMAIRGGTVTVWWGVICVALVIVLLVT